MWVSGKVSKETVWWEKNTKLIISKAHRTHDIIKGLMLVNFHSADTFNKSYGWHGRWWQLG